MAAIHSKIGESLARTSSMVTSGTLSAHGLAIEPPPAFLGAPQPRLDDETPAFSRDADLAQIRGGAWRSSSKPKLTM
jgi:hypothetical protein